MLAIATSRLLGTHLLPVKHLHPAGSGSARRQLMAGTASAPARQRDVMYPRDAVRTTHRAHAGALVGSSCMQALPMAGTLQPQGGAARMQRTAANARGRVHRQVQISHTLDSCSPAVTRPWVAWQDHTLTWPAAHRGQRVPHGQQAAARGNMEASDLHAPCPTCPVCARAPAIMHAGHAPCKHARDRCQMPGQHARRGLRACWATVQRGARAAARTLAALTCQAWRPCAGSSTYRSTTRRPARGSIRRKHHQSGCGSQSWIDRDGPHHPTLPMPCSCPGMLGCSARRASMP